MSVSPFMAEEIIDKHTRLEAFRGREWEMSTGRVVLHAVGDAAGHGPGRWPARRAACGLPSGRLAPTGRPWDSGYLPHLPRCGRCATAAGDPPPARAAGDGREGQPAGEPAADVDIRAVHGTAEEQAGAGALRDVLIRHDLRRWMFTDLVRVDAEIRGGFSHPLTINPGLLAGRQAKALTTFLHEQLHWSEGPGTDAATAEAARRWPEPPPPPAGCHDAESSWLHMSVCALEYRSLAEVIGRAAAAAELRRHRNYSWIYGQILADPGWFEAFLDRHGLRVPDPPPVPRRYIGEEWWAILA